jgi:hypothetical protein
LSTGDKTMIWGALPQGILPKEFHQLTAGPAIARGFSISGLSPAIDRGRAEGMGGFGSGAKFELVAAALEQQALPACL